MKLGPETTANLRYVKLSMQDPLIQTGDNLGASIYATEMPMVLFLLWFQQSRVQQFEKSCYFDFLNIFIPFLVDFPQHL